VRFGISLPNFNPADGGESIARIAQGAEKLGFDSVWVSDHVFIPYEYAPNYPYSSTGRIGLTATSEIFDPLITLEFVAGQVHRVSLGISVLIVPLRNPIITAKMLVTLDALSGGRVIFGAGTGWMPEQFDGLGASYDDRAKVTDEYIEIFRELCSAEKPVFEGEHYRIANVGFYPKPVQKPHPPVWVGGNSMTALRRAVRLGDGWHASNLAPEAVGEKAAALRRLCTEAGRDPATLTISGRVDTVTFNADASGPVSGTSQQMIDDLKRYEEAGLAHLVLGIHGLGADAVVATAQRFADEVRPHV